MLDESDNLSQSLLQVDVGSTPCNANNYTIFAEERFEPCRVCGEPSSGWHCGAVTCEACKKFFLRSINGEDAKYKCVRNKDCIIARATRTQCQYCRYKKCKEVGMTINDNPNNPTVAELFKAFPCSVCKAPSSGVHFGAITCEGCKGFFRRSIKERAPERYKCMDNGNCEVSVATRNMCRHCRFQKCIQAGMSAQNSRIGRQSNLFKHQIIELQRRGFIPNSEYLTNAQRKTKPYKSGSKSDNVFNASTDDYTAFLTGQDQLYSQMTGSTTDYMYNTQAKTEMQMVYNNVMQQQQQTGSNYMMHQQLNPDPSMQTGDMMNDYYYTNNQIINENMYNTSQLQDNQLVHQQQNHTPHHHHQQHHATTMLSYHPPLDTLFDKHTADFMKIILKLYLDVKTELLTFATNDFFNFDNDFDLVMEIMCVNSLKYLKFAENIPEMASLSIDDQNELFKNSIHSVVILILLNNCNFLNYFNCEETKFQKFLKFFPVFLRSCDFMRRMRDTFVGFKLDDIEYALYATLLIISPASQNLGRFDKVSEMRERVAECLHKYMLARRNEDNTHDDLLLLLINLRKFNHFLQDGILDSYQRIIRNEQKPIRSIQYFSRVYLPKNVVV